MAPKNKRETSPILPGLPTKKTKLKKSFETTSSADNAKKDEESEKIESHPQTALV